MNIPSQHYKTILEEFNKISQLCNDAKYLEDKLYFFSASFGIINRVMNFHCDPLLVFMHHILQTTHQGFVQRISQFQNPNLISNNIPDIFWDKLYLYFLELIKSFENKDVENIREILEKFTYLTYATTGNGFYLFISKKLTLK